MKRLSTAAAGIAILATVASSVTPAFALGGCGPNGHRDQWNHCVFGGQNQAFCLKTKGHPAVRMPDGTLRCI